jgi:hypothetical protein
VLLVAEFLIGSSTAKGGHTGQRNFSARVVPLRQSREVLDRVALQNVALGGGGNRTIMFVRFLAPTNMLSSKLLSIRKMTYAEHIVCHRLELTAQSLRNQTQCYLKLKSDDPGEARDLTVDAEMDMRHAM